MKRSRKNPNHRGGSHSTPIELSSVKAEFKNAYPNQGDAPPMTGFHSTYRGGAQSLPGTWGEPWTPSVGDWPGVDGIPANRNHYPLNTYGGRRTKAKRRRAHHTTKRKRAGRRHTRRRLSSPRQRGGTFSNFLGQDLVNLGRQAQFGIGSAYNILSGYPDTPDPMPWRDQLQLSS
jgi:hypothetical protein